MIVNIFAEELEQVLENASKTEAFAGGTIFGMALETAIIIGLVWFILEVIADWQNPSEKEPASFSDYCSWGRCSD